MMVMQRFPSFPYVFGGFFTFSVRNLHKDGIYLMISAKEKTKKCHDTFNICYRCILTDFLIRCYECMRRYAVVSTHHTSVFPKTDV